MRTIQRQIVGAYVVSSDQKVLLGQSAEGGVYQNVWTIPGGGIEGNETKEEAVCREVMEEVNVDIAGFKLTPLESAGSGTSEKTLKSGETVLVEMVFHDFVAQSDKPAAKISYAAGDDFKVAEWFDIANLEDIEITKAMRNNIDTVRKLCS